MNPDIIKKALPIDLEKFFTESYQRRPALWHNQGQHWADVFSLREMDAILNQHFFDPKNMSLYKEGHKFATEALYLPASQILDKKKVLELITLNGFSLKISNVHLYSDALSQLQFELARLLNKKIVLNLYFTPDRAPCFLPHQDSHSVFIMQITGSKRWEYRDESSNFPISYNDYREILKDGKTVDLKQGDLLYLPAMVVHNVQNMSDGPSLHLTIGIQDYQYSDLLQFIAKDPKASLFLERPLPYDPLKVDLDHALTTLKDFLDHYLGSEYAKTFGERFLNEQNRKNSNYHSPFNFSQFYQGDLGPETKLKFLSWKIIDVKPTKTLGLTAIETLAKNFLLPAPAEEVARILKKDYFKLSDFEKSPEDLKKIITQMIQYNVVTLLD